MPDSLNFFFPDQITARTVPFGMLIKIRWHEIPFSWLTKSWATKKPPGRAQVDRDGDSSFAKQNTWHLNKYIFLELMKHSR